jgi:pimeloyl-ACP methyl ester carboxylesterase
VTRATEISVYDRLCWSEQDLERALALGSHRRELISYLGPTDYATLGALARQAARAARAARAATRRGRHARAAPTRVYLLPGILGSQLGRPRGGSAPPDLLWLDPSDIVAGRLRDLRLRGGHDSTGLQPLGAVMYSYLGLKLRLAVAGFDVVIHDYDWRLDLRLSAQRLVARLSHDSAMRIALIGHSMGGVLARVALALYGKSAGSERIAQLITLGAPHAGSMAAVQTLRATYPVVCRLAAMDRRHDAAWLTQSVFRSFTSLYQLLPIGAGVPDLLDPHSWPRRGPQPSRAGLRAARELAALLPVSDPRCICIVGTGQRTVTGLLRREAQFHYEVSAAGDGTVAAARAILPGSSAYSLRCEHSELTRSAIIAAALVDLLRHGRTERLRAGVVARPGRRLLVTDAAIGGEFIAKIDWAALSGEQRLRYLHALSAPPGCYRRAALIARAGKIRR